MAGFDPGAWVAEYEAIGGHVSVVEWHDQQSIQFILPRDPAGRGNEMMGELRPSGHHHDWTVADWIARTRGVVVAGDIPAT